MLIAIKKDATPRQITQAIAAVKSTGKVLDAKRFAGKVKWGQNALEYQHDLRGE